MRCYAEQYNLKLAGGNSGESSICVATPANFIGDNMKQIKLTQGKYAIVDDEDFEWLNQWKWYANKDHKTYYARRHEGKKIVKMHRLILNASIGTEVDHKNHDGLDNRRDNIRICTFSQNQHRRATTKGVSAYRGVYQLNHSPNYKWASQIRANGKVKHLGCFVTEVEAAMAYNKAAKQYYGEFAYLN